MEFSRWNLYTSLGLAPQEPQGIGAVIYETIDRELQSLNQKIEEYQKEYESAFDQVRSVEVMLKNAGSESEARRLKAEYQSRAYHLRLSLEMRDEVHARGSKLSTLYEFLMKQYDEKFPEYFQEIYDPEMRDFQGELYEDIAAGFRLVYKYGRSDPSLWTLIYQGEQYIDALIDFFTSTESPIAAACEPKELRDFCTQITSRIIQHLRTEEFLESALQRMAKAHGVSLTQPALRQVEKLEKKPWSYTSGGTMTTLLKTYYRRESEFSSESRWVESETELLIFFIDTLKNLPPFITRPFEKDPFKGMLAASPTHAFILYPGLKEFKEGWQEEIFTYTWVRDAVFLPSHQFYASLHLEEREQLFLLDALVDRLPSQLASLIQPGTLSSRERLKIVDFRNRVLHALNRAPLKKNFSEEIDSFLYESLPVVPSRNIRTLISRLLSDKSPSPEKIEEALRECTELSSDLLLASEVKEIAKACYLYAQNSLLCAFDLHEWVERHARFIGLAAPTSLLIADTNWTNYFFGFVVNPGTLQLELWRVDRTLTRGIPMSSWKHWLNGSDKKAWTLYTNPSEYKG